MRRPSRRRQVTSPAVPRDRRLTTEVPPIQRVTIPCAGRSDVTSGPPAFQSKGSTFVEILGITCHVTLSLALVDLLLRDRTTGLSESPRRPPQRAPPGAGGPKAAQAGQDSPTVATALAAGLGARPSHATAAPRARRGETERVENKNEQTARPRRPPGGGGSDAFRVESDRSWSSRRVNPRGEPAPDTQDPNTRGSVPMRPRGAGPASRRR
jgi:hypothetical protein